MFSLNPDESLLTLVLTMSWTAPKRCSSSDYPLAHRSFNILQVVVNYLHATKSKKHNKKDLEDDCRDMVTVGGTCRDP
jgi:hypothetical protein